jgi:hypothetical protein
MRQKHVVRWEEVGIGCCVEEVADPDAEHKGDEDGLLKTRLESRTLWISYKSNLTKLIQA